MTTAPIPFDSELDVFALTAAGYEHQFVPADWQDIGGPESGPKLCGHPDMDVWFKINEKATATHDIVVVDGEVVEMGNQPHWPDCPF